MHEIIRGIYLKNVAVKMLHINSVRSLSIKKNADRRMERYLKKTADLIAGKTQKKKDIHPSSNLFQTNLMVLKQKESENSCLYEGRIPKINNPRVKRLSTVFYNYICSLIESGEVCPELLDLGFQISEVTVAPNFNLIIVSWLDTNSENTEKILSILPKCSADLRSVLTGLRVMGNVPPIQFSKDTSYKMLLEVEELLNTADMGPIENQNVEDEDGDDVDAKESVSSNNSRTKCMASKQSFDANKDLNCQNVYGVNYENMEKEIMTLKNKMKKIHSTTDE